MKKLGLLAVILASVPLMSAPEARQISVDRLYNLATVLGENFKSKPKKVGDVNALPINVLDIDVSGKQIALAWHLHTRIGGDPDKLNDAKKAIEVYADEVMEEAADVLAKQEEEEQAAQKLADEQEEKNQQTALGEANQGEQTAGSGVKAGPSENSGKSPPTGNDNTGNGDDKAYAVTTPIKWRGKVRKKEIKCNNDEADELRAQGLIA